MLPVRYAVTLSMFDNTDGIVVYVWYDRIVGIHPLLSFMINTIIRYYIYINRLTLLSINYIYQTILCGNHGTKNHNQKLANNRHTRINEPRI